MVTSEEFDTGAAMISPSNYNLLNARINTNVITPSRISEILSELPFYKVLTPAFRNYIAGQALVESYLAIETVPCENPQT